MKYKASEIGHLVESLSRFYKLSLSKGEDIVTIENELNHVRAYVQIQNMRFSNSIGLEINVPEDLYPYHILKIVLQPLVENAIQHGIFEKEEEVGTVTINGDLRDNDIILYVQDGGVGIPEEKLQNLLTGVSNHDSHGYGVRNINERLKLNYGSEFGLSYCSRPGLGTTVEIRIPIQK